MTDIQKEYRLLRGNVPRVYIQTVGGDAHRAYDDLRIRLEQALAMADVLSSVDESMIPQHAMYHYSNVLYGEIKASLQMWARHNGAKEDF